MKYGEELIRGVGGNPGEYRVIQTEKKEDLKKQRMIKYDLSVEKAGKIRPKKYLSV